MDWRYVKYSRGEKLVATKTKRVIIKEELVELTGDFKLAIVLNQMIYWSERKEDVESFVQEEVERLQKYADNARDAEVLSVNLLESHGWIYKKAEDLAAETMINVKPKAMREYLKVLVANGWLDERRNPKLKMDRTLQYRVNILKIQLDLNKLGYNLDGYPLPVVLDEKENTNFPKENSNGEKENTKGEKENRTVEKEARKGEKERAIPEITTEITSEILEEEVEEGAPCAKVNPFKFFEQNGFGTIGGHIDEKIDMWCQDLSDELVVKAMEMAVERGAKNFVYVETILRNWADKKIQTVEQAEALTAQYREQRSKKQVVPQQRKAIRTEKIPDYFNMPNYETLPQEQPVKNFEEEKQELEEMIKGLRS